MTGTRAAQAPPATPTPSPAAVPAPPKPPSVRPHAGAARILVVDDNVDAGEMLGEALTLAGNEVSVVHDPVAALALVDKSVPDVIVLDIGLPVMDGYELATKIRKRVADKKLTPPVMVALTGYGQPRDHALSTQAGFADHFVKPVDLGRLLKRLAELRRSD